LWSDSVGLLTRSGTDLESKQLNALNDLSIDLAGWTRFPDIPTPRSLMQYDEKEYLVGGLTTSQDDWARLLEQPLSLPQTYLRPKAIHLITEFPDEPMVATALGLREQGTLLSLEPLATGQPVAEWKRMLALAGRVNLVTPDWPTASSVAGSENPRLVVEHWSALGAEAVAVRHGAHGSYVWSQDRDEIWHVPAVPTKVVDPTGAGNAYGGGLCVGWTETRDIRLAGCYGAIAASMLLRHVGLPPMTDDLRQEAQAMIAEALGAAKPI
jgi:ribokinase